MSDFVEPEERGVSVPIPTIEKRAQPRMPTRGVGSSIRKVDPTKRLKAMHKKTGRGMSFKDWLRQNENDPEVENLLRQREV